MFCASDEYEAKSLPALFMEVNRHFGRKCFHQMKNLGIQPGQMPIIMFVAGNSGCSQREIARMMGVKPPTVNVSIHRLEKSEIVCRRRDEKDQRIMRVYLTEKGQRILDGIRKQSREIEKVMFNHFTEAELCLIRRLFVQILENIDKVPDLLLKNETAKTEKEGLE